jgi:hypothetical protein
MKTCTLCLILWINQLAFNTANAQVNVCVWCANNVNEQPEWGPTGYDFVYYYYMPEMEVYYYVPEHRFIYEKKGEWVTSPTLPARYAMFDLYRVYKAVINDDEPYLQNEAHRAQFEVFKKRHDQPVIRDSKDLKYQKRKGASGNPQLIG